MQERETPLPPAFFIWSADYFCVVSELGFILLLFHMVCLLKTQWIGPKVFAANHAIIPHYFTHYSVSNLSLSLSSSQFIFIDFFLHWWYYMTDVIRLKSLRRVRIRHDRIFNYRQVRKTSTDMNAHKNGSIEQELYQLLLLLLLLYT